MVCRQISAVRPRVPSRRVLPIPRQPPEVPFGYTSKALQAVQKLVFDTICGDFEDDVLPPAKKPKTAKHANIVRPGSLVIEDIEKDELDEVTTDNAADTTEAALSQQLTAVSWLSEGVVQLPFFDGHVHFAGAPEQQHSSWQLPKVQWETMKLPPVRKDFYKEHPTVAGRRAAELQPWMQKHQVVTFGEAVPQPILNFKELLLPQQLTAPLQAYSKPTVIQSLAWPVLLKGRDMVGIAETGSGKTLAFGLPAVVHASAQQAVQPGESPIALIVSPTRELALQILAEIQRLTVHTKLRTMCVYGGSNRAEQVTTLRQGVEVFIATVGRLLDIIQDGIVTMQRVTYFVLDEADRMLDMGFGPQMVLLRHQVRPDRQTAMFSATWPPEVQRLAAEFLTADHVRIQIGGLALSANPNVIQHVTVCHEDDKFTRLKALLDTLEGKVLIFAATRQSCKKLTSALNNAKHTARCIHSDMTQGEREQTMALFRKPGTSLLVATDVAARGLDVCDIQAVINFDFPATIADYIHRIGRTGRAGASGHAHSFLTSQDGRKASELIRVMEEACQSVPPDLCLLQRSFEQKQDHSHQKKASRAIPLKIKQAAKPKGRR